MSQLLLAVDTSGKNGSLALACSTPDKITVLEVVPLVGGAFSAELIPRMAALLEKHGHSKNDLCALAVVSGPGSFTGLRVGLAAVKGLAEALKIPIVAISLLEAVACSGATCGRVLAVLDAGRGDVYVGDYELDAQVGVNARAHSERLLSCGEFFAEVKAAAMAKTVVTPDPVLAEMVRAAGVETAMIEHPNSGVIARLGWEHFQWGQTIRPEDLEANYIRHSDAEIFSKPAR
jgi:tRNA threonylcarbamoyladenosine biosynthesis protein TsaB